MTGFVIVVDMQRDFVMPSGALPVPDAQALIAPMQDWLAALDPTAVAGVLMTLDTHLADVYAGSAEAGQFPLHCLRGTAGWESMLDAHVIDPAIPVYRMEKGVFDMWAEPGLTVSRAGEQPIDRDVFFARLAGRGVDNVTVVGVAADYCVRWAIEGLLARGFRVEWPASLTRGIGREAEAVAAEIADSALQIQPII